MDNDNVEERPCECIAWLSRFIITEERAFIRFRKWKIPVPWMRKTFTDEALHHFAELGACNIDQIIICPTKKEFVQVAKMLTQEDFEIDVNPALVPDSQLLPWTERYAAKVIHETGDFEFVCKFEAKWSIVEESILG